MLQKGGKILFCTQFGILGQIRFSLKSRFCRFFDTWNLRQNWPKSAFLANKNKNFKNLTKIFILMVMRTNISENEPNQTIWQNIFAFFEIFHKSRFSASNADFSVKIICISLNFYFLHFCPSIMVKRYTKFVFWSNL